jgi:hypothetical protein
MESVPEAVADRVHLRQLPIRVCIAGLEVCLAGLKVSMADGKVSIAPVKEKQFVLMASR